MPHLSRRFSGNAFLYIAIASIAAQAFIVLGQYLFPFFLGETPYRFKTYLQFDYFSASADTRFPGKNVPSVRFFGLTVFPRFIFGTQSVLLFACLCFFRMFSLLVSSLLAATTHPEISYTYFSAVIPSPLAVYTDILSNPRFAGRSRIPRHYTIQFPRRQPLQSLFRHRRSICPCQTIRIQHSSFFQPYQSNPGYHHWFCFWLFQHQNIIDYSKYDRQLFLFPFLLY